MKERLKQIILTLALCASATNVEAQESLYKFDFGGSAGMSGYLGDANTSSIFKHPGFSADINSRYIVNTRWAFRAMIGVQTLSGNSADMDNVLPGNATYSFNATVFDLGIKAEFNFFAYGIGETYKQLNRFSPYLTLGLGMSVSNCNGTFFAPALPMGFGLKYKLKPRLNLGIEFSMTKVIGDKVDGEILNDLTGIKTSFIKNTDWYSRLTVGITYEFGERCETCHYVD